MASMQNLKKWRAAYERFCQVPMPVYGRILPAKNQTVQVSGRRSIEWMEWFHCQVESVWSNRVPAMKKSLRTTRFSTLSLADFTPLTTTSSSHPTTEFVPFPLA